MIKSVKIMLIPNNKQKTKLFQYANTSRFAYNWALNKENDNYTLNSGFLSDNDLRKEFTQLKKEPNYIWLNKTSNNVTKQAIKDACEAYKRFFKGYAKYPKFKSRKKSKPSFYQDTSKIRFTATHVKLEGFSLSKKQNKQRLNWIKLAEGNRIPTDKKYLNPRISYDGINWWISVGLEHKASDSIPNNNGIGIDLGLTHLAICSDNKHYENINKTKQIKQLEKKRRRLQRQTSKKYILNKEGSSYKKTSNIIKSEINLLKLNHRLTNIRHSHHLKVINDIIGRKPMFITIENLSVKDMMKNKYLSKSLQTQALYEFIKILTYKCSWNNIELRQVDRFYPSSKLCHNCGYIKRNLKLSDRTYICPKCSSVIDRDYQASLNLRDALTYKIIA